MSAVEDEKAAPLVLLDPACYRLVFQRLAATDIALLAGTGCKALRKRIFSLDALHLRFEPTKKLLFPKDFLSSFTTLKSLIIGDPTSHDGPYMPGLDISVLPSSLTRLEVYTSNAMLSLYKLTSPLAITAQTSATPLPLKNMFPEMQHLHFLNGYHSVIHPFPGIELMSEVSQLPLVSLTYSPMITDIVSLGTVPSTLTQLKVICRNWMQLPRAKEKSSPPPLQVNWPSSLQSLDIRDLNVDALYLIDCTTFPKGLQRLRLEVRDSESANNRKTQLNLTKLPASLISFRLRHVGYILPDSTLSTLPPQLDELRLYIHSIRNETTNPSVYELLPRTLRTVHIFSSDDSPSRGNFYENLPPGIVDFCCDRPFGLYAPVVTGNATLTSLPANLVRSRTTPPENDCRPDDLLPSSLRLYSTISLDADTYSSSPLEKGTGGAGMSEGDAEAGAAQSSSSAPSQVIRPTLLLDIDVPVGSPLADYAERFSKLKRLRILYNHSHSVSDKDLAFLYGSKIETIVLGANKNVQTLSSLTKIEDVNTEFREHVTSLVVDHGKDGWNYAQWRHVKSGALPNLRSMSFDHYWFPHLIHALPPTLTELNLIRPVNWRELARYSGVIDGFGRPFDVFPLFPPTLLKLRGHFCSLHEGNVLGLLPRKLQELHLFGCEFSFTNIDPRIPIDQLFHLPTSLTRLTLPEYQPKKEPGVATYVTPAALRIREVGDIQLLHRFFCERPQLISSNIWEEEYGRSIFDMSPKRHHVPQEGYFDSIFDWFLESYPLDTCPTNVAAFLHPGSSIAVAMRDMFNCANNIEIEPQTLEPSPGASSSPGSPKPTESQEKAKPAKEKTKTGFFRKLFGAKVVEETPPSSSASSPPAVSAATSSSPNELTPVSYVYKEPEPEPTKKIKPKPQLPLSVFSEGNTDLTYVRVRDCAAPVDTGYAEYWVKETLRREKEERDARNKKKK